MKIISLSSIKPGYACGVAEYLNKYNFKYERDFFDYITVSMKSINEVINNQNIEFEETEIPQFIIPNPTNNIFVKFRNFNNMISYHDFIELSYETRKYWENFYKELQKKLINNIKSDDTIVFVRFCVDQNDIIENDIHLFCNNIMRINSNLDYYIIILSNVFLTIPYNLSNNPRFKYLNFRLYNSIYNTYTFNIYEDLLNNFDTKCFTDIINSINI
jgi:hypothetical protein